MATFEQKGHLKFKDAAGNLHVLSLDPSAHASTHKAGGSDAIDPASIGAVSSLGTVTATDLIAWAYEQNIGGSFFVTPSTTVNVPEAGYYVGFLDVVSNERRIDMTAINGLKRWVNQTRSQEFSGWVEQYNADNPPTAEDVGLVPITKTFHVYEDEDIPLEGTNVLSLSTGIHRLGGNNVIGLPSEHSRWGTISIFRYHGFGWGFALLTDYQSGKEWIADQDWTNGLVWREIRTSANPGYTYGTADLTPGSTPLETGKLYFVYE